VSRRKYIYIYMYFYKRFEVLRYTFKNKYKLMILNCHDATIQGKVCLIATYIQNLHIISHSLLFCCLISMHSFLWNWYFLFVLIWLISSLTFVFLVISLMVTNWYSSILIFRRYFLVSWVKTTVHTSMCYQISDIFGESIE
jgi:hypothetical protein